MSDNPVEHPVVAPPVPALYSDVVVPISPVEDTPVVPSPVENTPVTDTPIVPTSVADIAVTDTAVTDTPKSVVPIPIEIPNVIGYSPMYKPTLRRIVNHRTPNEPRLTYFPSMDDQFKRADANAIINTFLKELSRMRK